MNSQFTRTLGDSATSGQRASSLTDGAMATLGPDMMIEGVGGIRVRMDDDGANEEAVELVPRKGKRTDFRIQDVAFGTKR